MGTLTGVIAVFLMTVPLAAHANLSLDNAADVQCAPIATTECGCGAVLNPKTGWCEKGDNKYECICSQSDAGVVTTGICQADGICHAISTGGKTPQKPSQQVQQSTGGSGQPGSPHVSPDTKNLTPEQKINQDFQTLSSQSSQSSIGQPTPGQSLFQDALGQLQQMSGGSSAQNTNTGGVNASLDSQTGVPLWLSSGEVQLAPPDTAGTSQGNSYLGDLPIEGNGSFNPAQERLGSLGPSPQDAAYANTLVTAPSAADQAVVAAQNIGKGITETGGSWAQDALQYMDQPSPNSQQDYLTTYGVCNIPSGCDAIEGAPTTYSAHPDANGGMTHEIYTLDGYANGQYPYVTVAGPRDQQGDTGVIPQITYKDPTTGETQTLTNVPYEVADTGSSRYFPSGNSVASETGGNHFDVPISVPQNLYPSVTGSSAQMNSFLDAQPYNSSVASVIPTDSLSQSYAVSDPWNAPATGGLPAYAQQDSTSFPQSDYAWTQSVPEMSQLASVQSGSQAASDAGVPDLTLSSADNGPAYPSGGITSASLPPALTESQFAAQVENNTLQTEYAQIDAQTQAFNNPVMPPVDTSIPSGQAVTQDVYNAAIADAANQIPVPPQVEPNIPTQAQMQASLLADNGTSMSALDANQFYYDVQGDQYAPSLTPTPAGVVEQGPPLAQPYPVGEVTSAPIPNVAQPLMNQDQANAFYNSVEGSAIPQVQGGQTLADAPPSALSLIDTMGSHIGPANNGTVITSDLFDPNSVALGASSNDPAVAQAITQASQFSVSPSGTLPQNPPLPEERPLAAGPTGINIAGCGGVCEYNNAGPEVTAIQQFLNSHGANISVDGIYGSQTKAAVEAFQQSQTIAVDGIVGPQTVAAMNSVAQQNPSASQSTPAEQAPQMQPESAPQQPEENVPLPEPRPSAADQATLQPPQPTPMQLQAQRTENAFSASYSAYKSFINNPTQQSLARLVSSARYTQSIGLQFQNQTVQNFASQLGQMQQASGHSPWLVSTYLSSYRSQITAGFNTVRSVLNRYVH